MGEKSSCKQYCIANLRADVNHSSKWCVEDERAEGRPPSYLYPQKKQGLCLFFPSVHQLTSLLCLKPLNGFLLHLGKKSKLLPVTGKVLPAPVLAPSPASFPTALRLRAHLFREQVRLIPTSLPLPLPHLHVLAPSHLPGLCSYASCSERPSATILCGNLRVAIFVLLWFQCPSLFHLYISKMIVYLLADCLIGI